MIEDRLNLIGSFSHDFEPSNISANGRKQEVTIEEIGTFNQLKKVFFRNAI